MNSNLKPLLHCCALLFFFCGWAKITLPSLVSSDMVLQQNSEITLWGWGEPLEEVEVRTSWDSKVIRTVTDSHANWSVQVKTPKAGGPFEIVLT